MFGGRKTCRGEILKELVKDLNLQNADHEARGSPQRGQIERRFRVPFFDARDARFDVRDARFSVRGAG